LASRRNLPTKAQDVVFVDSPSLVMRISPIFAVKNVGMSVILSLFAGCQKL
jgi:hypothetical protein